MHQLCVELAISSVVSVRMSVDSDDEDDDHDDDDDDEDDDECTKAAGTGSDSLCRPHGDHSKWTFLSQIRS